MKQLYIIGGPMGVGKTTVCRELKALTAPCAFLDGDWCWDMEPFQVNEETKAMVMENICFLLNNFLRCSTYETIVFCWVMHEQGIIDEILRKLDVGKYQVYRISLVCAPEELERRIRKDIETGLRTEDVLERSKSRLPLYETLNTIKIDVSGFSPRETAGEILRVTEEL